MLLEKTRVTYKLVYARAHGMMKRTVTRSRLAGGLRELAQCLHRMPLCTC